MAVISFMILAHRSSVLVQGDDITLFGRHETG